MIEGIVEIQNLTLKIGERTLFDDFSWKSPAGKFSAWIAPSGFGKSSLARAVVGHIEALCGKILINGVLQKGPNRQAIRVANSDCHWDWMTLRQTVHFVSQLPKALSGSQIEKLIEDFSLAPLLDKYPNQMSDGQRQRLLILRSLITKPDVLILDESLNSLDWNIRQKILKVITEIAMQENIYLIFITHYPEELSSASFEKFYFERGTENA